MDKRPMGHIPHLRNHFQSINTFEKSYDYLLYHESPSLKNTLCQVWSKLVQWFWRRFVNFVNIFPLFCNYLPLRRGVVLHLNKLETPSPKDALCQFWSKLAWWSSRRRWKCEKFTEGHTDRRTKDNRPTEKLTWAFSWGERKKPQYITNTCACV